MRVRYEAKAVKDMKGLAPADRVRIREKIALYAANPAALANQIKALQGTSFLRLRVQDYRIIFSVEDDHENERTVTIMVVYRVRHRREAYDQH